VAVTEYQLENLITSTAGAAFLQRVAFHLGVICQNIESEAAGTALHAQRAALAGRIVTNPSQYAAEFAQQLITQLPLATTNLVTVNGVANADVDTTSASLETILSSIYNDFV
jgi:hypothetical protein